MEIGKTRLALSASMLALALALAGCGGGGSSGSTQASGPVDTTPPRTDPEPPPAPMPTATEQAVTAAKAALDAADDDDDIVALHGDYLMAAYVEKMAAEMAYAGASDEDKEMAEARRNTAVNTYIDAWMGSEDVRDGAAFRAMAIADGMIDSRVGSGDLGASPGVAGDPVPFMLGADGKVNPRDNERAFAKFSDGQEIADRLPGAQGSAWYRHTGGGYTVKDGTTDWVAFYTDKADKDAEFSEYYAATRAAAGTGFGWKEFTAGVTAPGGVVTINAGADATTATFKLLGGDWWPRSNDMKTLPANDPDTDAKENEFSGTFHGVPGTFACPDGGCTATSGVVDGEVKLTAITGTWTFKPTNKDETVAGVKVDNQYLRFGTWGQYTGMAAINTFAEAVGAPSTDLRSLSGTATYNGAAIGTFVKKMASPGGDQMPAYYGAFNATAMLTAQFGMSNTVPAADHNTISGSITGFMDERGEYIDRSWTVMLEKAGFGDTGIIGVDNNDGTTPKLGVTRTTGATGSMTKGKWEGEFLGGSGTGAEQAMPSAVTGTFDAHFTNGHVVGAFGARKPAE